MTSIPVKALKFNNFDLLRIFAASQVVLLHSVLNLKLAQPYGYTFLTYFPGVPMFFVMSGYLISASYERNTNLKSYLQNRFLRIYPALWFCIILTIIAAATFGQINFIHAKAPVWFISQLAGIIYTPYFLKPFGIGSYNTSLWTIPVELQFYLVLPVIYYLAGLFSKSKRTNQPFYIAWCIFLIIALTVRNNYPDLFEDTATRTGKLFRYIFVTHFYLFLTGVILQRLNASRSKLIAGKAHYWAIVYLVLCYFLPVDSLYLIFIKNLFLAGLTISLAYTLPGLSHKILRGNDISYGVYIYHGLLINIFVQEKLTGSYKYLALLAAITFILALFSWKFIEKPMLRRKKKTINIQLKEETDALQPEDVPDFVLTSPLK